MPTTSPSPVLQLCLLYSSKQKFSVLCISWDTWSAQKLGFPSAWNPSGAEQPLSKRTWMPRFSGWSPSLYFPVHHPLPLQLHSRYGESYLSSSWPLIRSWAGAWPFTICPGGSFAARYSPTRPVRIHQIQAYVSSALGMNHCTLIWKASLCQSLHDCLDTCSPWAASTFTDTIALAGHCICLCEILRTPPILVPTAQYFRARHRKNNLSLSTTCIFNSLS